MIAALIGIAILALATLGTADLIDHRSVVQPSRMEQINR